MDEQEFENTYRNYIHELCPFQKAILSTTFSCKLCQKVVIAEREAVTCGDANARHACRLFIQKLKDNAGFALKHLEKNAPMPHNKEIKLLCGGLQGLGEILTDATSNTPLTDVYTLLTLSVNQYGHVEQIPYHRLVRAITTYQPRNKKKPPQVIPHE